MRARAVLLRWLLDGCDADERLERALDLADSTPSRVHEMALGVCPADFAGVILSEGRLQGVVPGTLAAPPREPAARPPLVPLEGLFVLLLVFLSVSRATGAAVREPTPANLQQAVKTGVLALVFLDAGIVAAVRGPIMALAVAALWIPAFLLGKWLYST